MLTIDDNGESPPILYLSLNALPVHKNYSATELEFYALTTFVKRLRHFLIGNNFKVFTDREPLISIMRSNNLDNLRLIRMKLSLADYQMTIKYVKGTKNKVPDYWSRYPIVKRQ